MARPRSTRAATSTSGAFELGDFARWTYDIDGVTVVKELLLLWQKNTVALRYTVDAGGTAGKARRRCGWRLLPFMALRDFHAPAPAGGPLDVQAREARRPRRRLACRPHCADAGAFVLQPDWWYGHTYPIEADRGRTHRRTCSARAGSSIEGDGKLSVTLWASIDEMEPGDWDAEFGRRRRASGGDVR